MFSISHMKYKDHLPEPEDALPGRSEAIVIRKPHAVLGNSLHDYPVGSARALFGMGCFWGAERIFWQQAGVYSTAVGYSAGFTPNPTYEEVCTGLTGHNEVVLVVYWPEKTSYQTLLRIFWENHNPTQGMRQGNDRGTQYRSGIYYFDVNQKALAERSLAAYQDVVERDISTEIRPAPEFYFAEEYHQQYLAKNPNGYCNLQTLSKSHLPALPEF